MAPALRCPLCRQSFFSGRGHVYSRKHQQQLRAALERLLPQVEAARKAVRTAQVERYSPEHDQCCWCLCCGCEVQKHLSHGNMTVLHGGLLEHLACPDHRKATNKFWWENKADILLKEKFVVSQQDYTRFKKSMVKALDSYEEKEDEMIKKMAAQIREVERSRQEVVQSVLEVGFQRRLQSTSGSARPRRGLFIALYLERNQQVRTLEMGVLKLLKRSRAQKVLNLVMIIIPTYVQRIFGHLCEMRPSPTSVCPSVNSWLRPSISRFSPVFFCSITSSSQQLSLNPLPAPELNWMEATQSLTFIGHQVKWECHILLFNKWTFLSSILNRTVFLILGNTWSWQCSFR
uniref:Centrosomal AT-AC splicing factor n=1 Tax=Sarcophilus harrisii TaxID=9305 RepID=A0A7N4NTC3_SARHA